MGTCVYTDLTRLDVEEAIRACEDGNGFSVLVRRHSHVKNKDVIQRVGGGEKRTRTRGRMRRREKGRQKDTHSASLIRSGASALSQRRINMCLKSTCRGNDAVVIH